MKTAMRNFFFGGGLRKKIVAAYLKATKHTFFIMATARYSYALMLIDIEPNLRLTTKYLLKEILYFQRKIILFHQ
jgi:hypothetical protein